MHRHRVLVGLLALLSTIAGLLVSTGSPAAADPPTDYLTLVNRDGREEVFTIGNGTAGSCALYHNWETRPGDRTSWNGWRSLGGCLQDPLDLNGSINPDGRLEVFAIGAGNYVYHIYQSPAAASGWSAWQQLNGGRLGRAPTVQSNWGSPIYLLGPGVPPDRNVYCTEQNPAAPSGWNNWHLCVG
jgi:hypothetical protein